MNSSRVVVLDYGSGNLRSVQRALQRVGAHTDISADYDQVINADGLVVPGVGAFEACMHGLARINGQDMICARLEKHRPILGICVGMQILCAHGVEHGVDTPGCGIWPGSITQLEAPVIPHMGWNTIQVAPGSILFDQIPSHTRFYFVHSYGLRTWSGPHQPLMHWTTYYEPFIAAIEDGPLMATQFHPEKSGDAGAALLANWVGTL